MSQKCQLFGTGPAFGKSVSHSHRRTNRRFNPNIQKKRFWLPSEKRYVRLTLSARAIKTVDRRGIESVIATVRANGYKV
ncbi:MAG: 50S ribosomal protein L28 [Ilumatobacteraceae bacterium]|nr:50S ribosomal protein L28 [Ilumatobacteraceae bacterium]